MNGVESVIAVLLAILTAVLLAILTAVLLEILDHVGAAYLAGAHALVTTDHNDLLQWRQLRVGVARVSKRARPALPP
jgi:hypothetical protein